MKHEKGIRTLVKFRNRSFALFRILELRILLVGIICLYVVPRVELEDVVLLLEQSRAKLKGISPFHVVLRIMRSMRGR